jgi:hypothetical protein
VASRVQCWSLPVISVSEWRTSKHCLCCGRNAKHPWSVCRICMGWVTVPPDTDHCRMLNHRDVDAAAQKIGYRFMAQWMGEELGPCGVVPWQRFWETRWRMSLTEQRDVILAPNTILWYINSNGSDIEIDLSMCVYRSVNKGKFV